MLAPRIIPKHVATEIVDRTPEASNPLPTLSLALGSNIVDAVADNKDAGRENGEESPLRAAECLGSEQNSVEGRVHGFRESRIGRVVLLEADPTISALKRSTNLGVRWGRLTRQT